MGPVALEPQENNGKHLADGVRGLTALQIVNQRG